MTGTSTSSAFAQTPVAPPDAVFLVSTSFREDADSKKVNMGVGGTSIAECAKLLYPIYLLLHVFARGERRREGGMAVLGYMFVCMCVCLCIFVSMCVCVCLCASLCRRLTWGFHASAKTVRLSARLQTSVRMHAHTSLI